MSNNIAVITQDDFEETIVPNQRVTMTIPNLAPMLVAKIPEKKMHQQGLWGRDVKPTHAIKVKGHTRKIAGKQNGNNKRAKAKAIKNKKKNGGNEHSAITNVQEDCKESKQLAHSLHIQEMQNLFNTFKK